MTAESMHSLIDSYYSYKALCETEATKREQIAAERDAYVAKIEAQRQMLENYFAYSFKERRENFDQLFKALDKAIEKGDDTAINGVLTSMVTLFKESPLAQAKEVLRMADAPNVKEIEF